MIIHFSVEFQFFGIPGDIFLFQSVSPPDISSRRQVLTHKKNLGKIQRPVFPEIITDTAFTGDTAAYEQAVTAYYVAYQEYSNQMSGYTTTWTDFANGLFANANIRLYGVYA